MVSRFIRKIQLFDVAESFDSGEKFQRQLVTSTRTWEHRFSKQNFAYGSEPLRILSLAIEVTHHSLSGQNRQSKKPVIK